MNKTEIIELMALAAEGKKVEDYNWTSQEFHTWCYKDAHGIRSFKKSKDTATRIYNTLHSAGVL